MSLTSDQGPKCPMCKIIAIKLVPMQDNDQRHTEPKACINCKRRIRYGD